MVFNVALDRIRSNVAAATTEDLLDRATVYRAGMEAAALEIIDAELRTRQVTAEMLREHWENRRSGVLAKDGIAVRCSYCWRPAVARRWGWQRMWGRIPVLPWRFAYCAEHSPTRPTT